MKPIHLALLILLALTLMTAPVALGEEVHNAPEPRVKVITRPQWISGQVAVHVFTFPDDGATLKQKTVTVQIAVWGVETNRPVYLILDGEEAGRIETPGYYRYEWDLAGSHHLTFRDDYAIFTTAQFNIAPPPPPTPMVTLDRLNEELQTLRVQVFTVMLLGTLVGTPTGAYLKRRTKIFTEWAMVPFGFFLFIGVSQLDTLYAFIPLGLSGAISYVLAGGYADETLVLVAEEGQVLAHLYTMDDEDHIVQGFGPRYWRTGFIDRAKIELVDHRHPVSFKGFGRKLNCITVAGEVNIVSDPATGDLSITCSPALARALTERGVIEKLELKLADTQYRILFMERALNSIISSVIMEMETIMGDLKIDRLGSVGEAKKVVDQATGRLKDQLLDIDNWDGQPAGEVAGVE